MNKRKLDLSEEKKLVEKAKKDANAFAELYDLYVDKIYLYTSYKVGNIHDAQDITAQTFEKALKKIKDFEWKGYTFGSWLYRIAHNLIIDKVRSNKNVLSVEEIIDFTVDIDQDDPEEIASRRLDTKIVMDALTKIPEDQREIIYLRYIRELSIKETMDVTGKSIDAVKSLAKRGMKKLRDILE